MGFSRQEYWSGVDKGDATISVPPMYYVKQVLNSSSFETNQKNAMIAYYNYFDAAKLYKK